MAESDQETVTLGGLGRPCDPADAVRGVRSPGRAGGPLDGWLRRLIVIATSTDWGRFHHHETAAGSRVPAEPFPVLGLDWAESCSACRAHTTAPKPWADTAWALRAPSCVATGA
jgi:hypothetical protein